MEMEMKIASIVGVTWARARARVRGRRGRKGVESMDRVVEWECHL